MRKQMSNSGLFLCFTALTGAVIAGLVWLGLLTAVWFARVRKNAVQAVTES